jgi:hypothetical protein
VFSETSPLSLRLLINTERIASGEERILIEKDTTLLLGIWSGNQRIKEGLEL